MVKVLIVEDSPTVQQLLAHILRSDEDVQVIGIAGSGEEALELLTREKPDVITMDVHLPKIDGLETTRRIMETRPVPIVIVSASWEPEAVDRTFRAIEAGALAVAAKPRGMGHPDHERMARQLVQTVKLMSEVRVVTRRPRSRPTGAVSAVPAEVNHLPGPTTIRLVAMGSSTGGPPVLETILSSLPAAFPVPILLVHHIAPGFLQGLVGWLRQTTPLQLQVAAHGEPALPGHAYFAPDGFQMGVDSSGRIALSRGGPENGMCPSVSYLFGSVAKALGQSAVGVLLTGMGKDGAEELKLLKEAGGVTIAQDRESSVVHGMPGEAIRLGAARYVLPPEQIASTLRTLVTNAY